MLVWASVLSPLPSAVQRIAGPVMELPPFWSTRPIRPQRRPVTKVSESCCLLWSRSSWEFAKMLHALVGRSTAAFAAAVA